MCKLKVASFYVDQQGDKKDCEVFSKLEVAIFSSTNARMKKGEVMYMYRIVLYRTV